MGLREIAQQAVDQRQEGGRCDSTEFPLHSYCFDNSFVLYSLLEENNYSPKIVEGTTEWYADGLIQEGVDLDDLNSVKELAGYVHYWVEVSNKIIDISSHDPDNFGDILITSSLPESYYRFEDSYAEGKKSLQSARSRICSYCGGRKNYCGCPYESSPQE